MTIDELVSRDQIAAAEHWDAQKYLGDRAALKRSNQAAQELRRISTEIGRRGPSDIQQFSAPLGDSRNGVYGWAAFHILEVMQAPPSTVDRAFKTLEEIAKVTTCAPGAPEAAW